MSRAAAAPIAVSVYLNEIKNEIKKNLPAARDVSRLEPLLLLLLLCCRFDALRWPGGGGGGGCVSRAAAAPIAVSVYLKNIVMR